MKGLLNVRFGMPNLGRLRARLENAPAELSSDIRKEAQKVVVEALNEANLSVRSKLIAYVESRTDLKFKTPAHKKQVTNLMSGIFDTVFAVDAESLEKILGEVAEKAVKAAEAEKANAPKKEKAPKKESSKKVADKKEAPKSEVAEEAAADQEAAEEEAAEEEIDDFEDSPEEEAAENEFED